MALPQHRRACEGRCDMATKQRGHGEGGIRQRPDGTWEARLSLPGGKRKSLYAKTRREV